MKEFEKKMKSEKTIALYGRVSTTTGQDPAMQLRELREYCKLRGWKIQDEYVDRGVSGGERFSARIGSPDDCRTPETLRRCGRVEV